MELVGGLLEIYTAVVWVDTTIEAVKEYVNRKIGTFENSIYTRDGFFGNSEFNRVSTAYLRLKSVELGYTLPKLKALNGMSLRVYANAYNLLTFSGVKFVDPEHPDSDLGRLYPLNKTYTFGLQLSF